jgi:ribonuclease Z
MKAILLGSGSALLDPDRGNPSQAVVVGNEVLLFDCGERTTVNLVKAGVNPLKVGYLFFTHLHWDHIVDYGYLVMTSWNVGRKDTLKVFGPPGTKSMSDSTIFGTHATDILHMKIYLEQYLPPQVTNRPQPEVPISVSDIGEGEVLKTPNFKVISRSVEHYNKWGIPCLGYRVESSEGVVAISGDTSPCPQMIDLAKNADVLIHECAFLDEIIQQRGMKSHSGPSGAGKVAQEAGAKKLILTHLGPYTSCPAAVEMASMYYGSNWGPEVWSKIVREVAKYYDGPIVLGQDAMTIEI